MIGVVLMRVMQREHGVDEGPGERDGQQHEREPAIEPPERKLQDSILLLGRFPFELMPYFFSKADSMLISLKNENVLSLTVPAKLQTYMACSKPILAMANGETRDIIDKAKAGLTCGSGDYQNLAKNVLKMFHMSSNEKLLLSKNSLNYYNAHFKKERIIAQLESLFLGELNQK